MKEEANNKRLLNTENKLRVAGGCYVAGGGTKWVWALRKALTGMRTGCYM